MAGVVSAAVQAAEVPAVLGGLSEAVPAAVALVEEEAAVQMTLLSAAAISAAEAVPAISKLKEAKSIYQGYDKNLL